MSEKNEFSPEELNKALFAHLVAMLATSAMQHMGKIVNPATKKAETDLEGAQATIDMLDMLEAKTRGNLDKQEEKMMRDTLMSLKMNFVETMEHAPQEPEEKADTSSPKVEPASDTPKGKDDDGSKFHKTYG